MLTCSWSGRTAPGANRIRAVIRPVSRSNSSVLASQPGKRVFCHSMLSGRTRWECVSAICAPFGVTASMAILRSRYFDAILAALPLCASRQVCGAVMSPPCPHRHPLVGSGRLPLSRIMTDDGRVGTIENLQRVLGADACSGAASRCDLGAISRVWRSPEPNEPQYLHHLRTDVHEGDAGAQDHDRRDYHVCRSARLHQP